jgi:glycosyltransferase involved in cell wall biosynthesis
MRLLFLSHYFPPEVNAPANRVSEVCREWVRLGHEVHVVTCFPSHPRGVLYDGWTRRWHVHDVADGIHVHRVATILGANRGFGGRVLNYLSFVPTAVWRAIRLGHFDGIVATSPQFFCAVAGALSAALTRTPWVFELRDLWPDSIVAVGAARRSPAIRVLESIELGLYRHAVGVVCVSPAFVENLVSRGIEPGKVDLVPNGVDASFWSVPGDGAGWRARHGFAPSDVVVSFVGTIGMAHGLGTVLEAAARVARSHPELRFLVVGDGAERRDLEAAAARRGLGNVAFTGLVPRAEVRDVMAATDISLVLLRNSPVFRTVLPTKMFEAMAAGRPVVLGVNGQAREVLEASGGGVFVPPENVEALVETAIALAGSPERRRALGESGRAYVGREYDRAVWARRYAEILERRLRPAAP